VLNLQKADSAKILSVPTADKPLEDLLTKEWLLTNERGGYASSTVVGCNTRRYHGLLIGSVNPLANRIMGLSNCLEMVMLNGRVFNLSTFEFNGKFAPEGFKYIKRFHRDIGAHFAYQVHESGTSSDRARENNERRLSCPSNKRRIGRPLELTKSVYLARDTDTVALVYDFRNIESFLSKKSRKPGAEEGRVEFVLRPFIGLRDFHALQKSYAPLRSIWLGDGLLVRHEVADSCELLLGCCSMDFRKDPQWWFNFVYRNDEERGQDFSEDLWSPGFFKCRLDRGARIVLWASLRAPVSQEGDEKENPSSSNGCEQLAHADVEAVRRDLYRYHEGLKRKAKSVQGDCLLPIRDSRYAMLCLAADQFIANRQINHRNRTTILAGFPWFADWGRDAFVSLAGLLLVTGRFEEARSVLTSFAQAADEGMIPNRFDDYSDTAYFNSIDASVWFVHAAFQYLHAAGDSETFTQELLPTIRRVVDSFQNGTRFGIRADADGLITGGGEGTQLTWMDAKYEGVAFTARCGKAVEVNALWYNALCNLAQFDAGRDKDLAEHYQTMANQAASSFCKLFWNEEVGYLNDCILPDGSVDASLRPNQIFAVSLPFSPLSPSQARCTVAAVEKHLLTPYGLRTLSAADGRYRGEYTGPQQQRDEAYHQGTVWPYLIGPFVEAYLKVNDFCRKSKKKSAEFIEPLMRHLAEDGCLGQVSEIFDGDPPHKPRGCIAQAWSVAELMRVYRLISG
jgi:glycogen debranching enzyme